MSCGLAGGDAFQTTPQTNSNRPHAFTTWSSKCPFRAKRRSTMLARLSRREREKRRGAATSTIRKQTRHWKNGQTNSDSAGKHSLKRQTSPSLLSTQRAMRTVCICIWFGGLCWAVFGLGGLTTSVSSWSHLLPLRTTKDEGLPPSDRRNSYSGKQISSRQTAWTQGDCRNKEAALQRGTAQGGKDGGQNRTQESRTGTKASQDRD